MRWLLALLLLLATVSGAEAAPPSFRGGGGGCPAGSPSSPTADGARILPQVLGANSCTLYDGGGNSWQYQGPNLLANGSLNINWPFLEINAGHNAVTQNLCRATYLGGPSFQTWLANSNPSWSAPIVNETTVPSPLPFANTHASVTTLYSNAPNAFGAAAAGDHIEIGPLQAGRVAPFWFGGFVSVSLPIAFNNMTVTIDANSALGCGTGNNAIITISNGVSGTIIEGQSSTTSMLMLMGGNGERCINGQNAVSWTVRNLMVRDCDFGMQANTAASGNNSAFTNVIWDHNGGALAGSNSGPDHNFYLGGMIAGNLSKITISGGGSYCVTTSSGPGFMAKTRWTGGTFQNWTASEPDPYLGFTDCGESAAVDLSCGGNYTLGGAAAQTGIVLEVGPGLAPTGISNTNGEEFVRYDRDSGGGTSVNCGAPTDPGRWTDSECNSAFGISTGCALLLQNCILINDSPITVQTVLIDANVPANRVTVKNCTFVENQRATRLTGDTHASSAFITNLSATPASAGWVVGDVLSDTLGDIPLGVGNQGDTIAAIDNTGASCTPVVAAPCITVNHTLPSGHTGDTIIAGGRIVLGTGVLDGGGNTTVNNRTALGVPYPGLPSPP